MVAQWQSFLQSSQKPAHRQLVRRPQKLGEEFGHWVTTADSLFCDFLFASLYGRLSEVLISRTGHLRFAVSWKLLEAKLCEQNNGHSDIWSLLACSSTCKATKLNHIFWSFWSKSIELLLSYKNGLIECGRNAKKWLFYYFNLIFTISWIFLLNYLQNKLINTELQYAWKNYFVAVNTFHETMTYLTDVTVII
jgi:hypothetical protein